MERSLQFQWDVIDDPRDGRADPGGGFAELRIAELERWARPHGGPSLPLRDWLALAEAWRIAQALRETRGNRSAAARLLGIGRRTLYSKMDKLGLEASWSVSRRDPFEPRLEAE
jgi:DNA-binding NtrC family response regulator